MTQLKLELGKKYKNKKGEIIKIIREREYIYLDFIEYIGIDENVGIQSSYNQKGIYLPYPDLSNNLISEDTE